jgi:uracil-DNA glycosylase family 4
MDDNLNECTSLRARTLCSKRLGQGILKNGSAMNRKTSFYELEETIIRCSRCPRLVEWRQRIAREKAPRFRSDEYWGRPVPALGEADSRLIIIGLAPAAHGANRTGRMFTGDRSGAWLFEALHRFGFASHPVSTGRHDSLRLQDCLITAALRCAPPGNKPLPQELLHCRPYLRKELQMAARKKVIITLGQIAFSSYLKAWQENGERIPGQAMKFGHDKVWSMPGGVTLIASYHPSQQNTQTGRLTREMFDRIFFRARRVLYGSFSS